MHHKSKKSLDKSVIKRARARRFKVMSRHPFAVPFITFFAFGLVIAGGYLVVLKTHKPTPVKDTAIVVVSHDNKKQIVPTRAATVGALLKGINLELNVGDVVEPALTTPIDQDQFRINVYRAVPVAIVDGGHRSFTFSAATTPRSIAAQTGAKLYPDDLVTTNPAQDFVKTGTIGEQVIINRATPVNLNLYGAPLALRTHATTVGDLVKQKNIKLAKDDQLLPAADTLLTPNVQIFVVRNGIKIETVEENIAMPVQQIQDETLAYGTSAVRQQGSPGHRVVTYQVSLQNGIATGRTVIQTVETQTAVTQILVVGTSLSGIKGDMALAGIAPSDYDFVDYIISHESGWNPAAHNASGAFGLCQALPGSKMVSAGADWATNPVTQLRWCNGYAQGRYGSWGAAYNYWLSHRNW